jgi:hypothetical protein
VYIDRPDGVDLDLCVAVTHALDVLRDTYRLEVSSPGLDRPLRKPEQFARVTGSEVTVRTAAPLAGRASYRGVLTAAGDTALTMRLDDGRDVTISYADVAGRVSSPPSIDWEANVSRDHRGLAAHREGEGIAFPALVSALEDALLGLQEDAGRRGTRQGRGRHRDGRHARLPARFPSTSTSRR